MPQKKMTNAPGDCQQLTIGQMTCKSSPVLSMIAPVRWSNATLAELPKAVHRVNIMRNLVSYLQTPLVFKAGGHKMPAAPSTTYGVKYRIILAIRDDWMFRTGTFEFSNADQLLDAFREQFNRPVKPLLVHSNKIF